MSYISISLYKKIVNHGLAEGLTKEDLSALPVSLEKMEQLQAVPSDQFFATHELLDDKLGPGFSVRVGQEMKIDDYGVLGLSWRTCSWAGEIFVRSERYFKLLSDTYVFKVEKRDDWSYIYLHREPHRRGVELSNEATLSATVVVLQAITETDILPVQVAFKHKAPSDLASYNKAFQCELLFEQPHYYIAYKTKDLELRTAKADESINKFLVERVKEETEGIEADLIQFTKDIERLIQEALPSGIPSVGHIAEHIGMSNRTLTRRLAEHGVTFRDLIKKTQENIAKDLLTNSNRSIAEIAFETGFSEQSAFNRAFKRWAHQSPLEFRNK
ncbi:MAG: AraC family transcriptional regulator ligand-binding domain-containing protein [Fulvivirga sp.]|uniref:AraC family transcriptional regulator n=1 Tax=Fulvivirga sp. TaxID=1931237 RepID=UPI0032EECD03